MTASSTCSTPTAAPASPVPGRSTWRSAGTANTSTRSTRATTQSAHSAWERTAALRRSAGRRGFPQARPGSRQANATDEKPNDGPALAGPSRAPEQLASRAIDKRREEQEGGGGSGFCATSGFSSEAETGQGGLEP